MNIKLRTLPFCLVLTVVVDLLNPVGFLVRNFDLAVNKSLPPVLIEVSLLIEV